MSQTRFEKAAGREVLIQLTLSPLLDAWILMLVLGGLHSRQGWAINFSYWTCLLIVYVSITILPQGHSATAYLKQIMNRGA